MASLTLSLATSAAVILKEIERIQKLAQCFTGFNNASVCEIEYSGYLKFYASTAHYRFESLEELKDALVVDNLDDIYIWGLNICLYQNAPQGSRVKERLIKLSFGKDFTLSASTIEISGVSYADALELVKQLCELLNCELAKINQQTEEELVSEKLMLERSACIHRCIDIFERLPELQARIAVELKSEKAVQDFLYPILKSHFPKLQEEDYLPKVAGTASKPDFGIEELGVAIEVKYINKAKTFKKLGEEVNVDSRKYFGRSSPFRVMIVLIYNGASKPTPANFIADLEHVDVIEKVIISPNIILGARTYSK